MSALGKVLGAAGIITGVLGAAALGGVTVQRRAARKYREVSAAAEDIERIGDLAPDREYSVAAEDGVVLHVSEVGPVDAPVVIIFSHGWTLRTGAWHFQRFGLAGPGFGQRGDPEDDGIPRVSRIGAAAELQARLVFYDQRSHGKSSRSPEGHSTMEYLASDLRQVAITASPHTPVILIGHSMGGMVILTLAEQDPALFAERVAGVGLVCTGATTLRGSQLNRLLVQRGNGVVRMVTNVATRYPQVLERGRAGSRDAAWLLTRSLGFARKDVSAALVDHLDEMISGTPVDVIAEYAPTLLTFDRSAALPALAGIPTVIVAGDQDRMTPLARSQAIADALPDAEFVVAPGSGHLAMMEDPELVNGALREMVWRAVEHAGLGVDRDQERRRSRGWRR